jgi:uncharacterized membrane protein (UPF0127 family)
MKLTKILAFKIFLLLALIIAGGCQRQPRVQITTQTGSTPSFHVEIADNEVSREQGLQYRESLDKDKGMLFVFPNEQQVTFWMKNTSIPLDMVFINSDLKVVGIIPNATPFSLAPLAVSSPSLYVLEINGGVAQIAGIHTGDQVKLTL